MQKNKLSNEAIQQLKPYILAFTCLLIGAASIACLCLTVAATFANPKLAFLPFSAFVLTLRMAYGLARMLIAERPANGLRPDPDVDLLR